MSRINQNTINCSYNNCNEQTDKGYLCKNHLLSQLGLFIDKSQIPNSGLGLFSNRFFRKGDIICDYRGQKILNTTVSKDNKYILEIDKKYSIDGEPSTCNFGRFANMARTKDTELKTGKKLKNNSQITNAKPPNIVATRIIHPGDEILLSYGRVYWKDEDKLAREEKKETDNAIAQVAALPSVSRARMIKSGIKTIS
jgi:hypothetical protein